MKFLFLLFALSFTMTDTSYTQPQPPSTTEAETASILGTKLQLTSVNFPNHVLAHNNFKAVLTEDDGSDQNLMYNSSFYVVPGLAGNGISFKSFNYPNLYLGHRDGECFIIDPSQDTEALANLTWEAVSDLAGVGGDALSFHSDGLYLFHQDFRLKVARIDGDPGFQKDASWFHKIDKSPKYDRSAIGEWVLIHAYDGNTATWEYSQGVNVGVSVNESTSTTKTDKFGWKTSLEVEGGGFGNSVKAMAESSGEHSVSKMSSQSFSQTKNVTTLTKVSGVKADGPLYIWQWVVNAKTAEQYSLVIKSNITRETKTRNKPTEKPY